MVNDRLITQAYCRVGRQFRGGHWDPTIVWIDVHPRDVSSHLAGQMLVLGAKLFGTNNPYVVDHFHGDNVICVAVGADGFTYKAPLSSHPEWIENGLSTGEFWAAVGEQWVIDQAKEKP